MRDEDLMRRAIALSREKMETGVGGPFGAVIARDGRIVSEGWNQVATANDPTAHAEIVAIRAACRALGTFRLDGCTIYASCEPCPMCLAAIYWARLDRLCFANSREDAARIGFDDAHIGGEVARDPEACMLPSVRLLAAEARSVFDAWTVKPDKVRY